MTYPAIYYVDRTTDTSADALVAFGLTDLLSKLIPESEDWGLMIEATGTGYSVSLRQELPAECIDNAIFTPLFSALRTNTKQPDLPPAYVVDYVAHKKNNENYFKVRENGATQELLREQGLTPPHPDWGAWALVSQMLAVGTFNNLARAWHSHKHNFPDLMRLVFQLYSRQPNPINEMQAQWSGFPQAQEFALQVPALQITNPAMGKGGNKTKTDGFGIGGREEFWIGEYLKYAGLFKAALIRSVKGSKDRRVYIIRPRRLSWKNHREVFPMFRETLFSQSAVKMDILATLHYCQVFVEQWKAGQISQRFAKITSGRPGDHVAALEVTSYKHMGSAYATMNLSMLALPQWLREVATHEQATRFFNLIAEHTRVIRGLAQTKKEQHGKPSAISHDEHTLLVEYRHFLSSGDLRHFFHFVTGYSTVLMSRLGDKVYAPQFTQPNLEVLFMEHDPKLSDILKNPGFRRVTRAIRASTVYPQLDKANRSQPNNTRPKNPYDVRYGLGAELMRNAPYKEKFAQALSRLLFIINQETLQIIERYAPEVPPVRRVIPSEDDIQEVLSLMDVFDSETVASLLVACGYALGPKRKLTEPPPPDADELGESEDVVDLDESDDED